MTSKGKKKRTKNVGRRPERRLAHLQAEVAVWPERRLFFGRRFFV